MTSLDLCPRSTVSASPFPALLSLRGLGLSERLRGPRACVPTPCRSGSVSVLDSLSFLPVLVVSRPQASSGFVPARPFSAKLFYPRDARGAIQRSCVHGRPTGSAQCRCERLRARRNLGPRRRRCPSSLSPTKGGVSSFSGSDSGSSGNEQRGSECVSP